MWQRPSTALGVVHTPGGRVVPTPDYAVVPTPEHQVVQMGRLRVVQSSPAADIPWERRAVGAPQPCYRPETDEAFLLETGSGELHSFSRQGGRSGALASSASGHDR